ncbi:MAG: acyl-CoA thioesterase [Candidatus Nomurabacteria bacterium]|nr:acyl-CoA thioesterase [Candidatus Nomurabacteria bacterium]
MNKIENICVFGDSTAWGAWDKEKGGWANRLWLHLANRNDFIDTPNIYNQSISGGDSSLILERFENESKVRECDALIFQTAGNDSYLVGKNGPNNISIENFEDNIENILKKAKAITKHVIFIGYKEVDDSKTAPVPWDDIYYLNSEIERYNKVMQKVCENNNVLFLNMGSVLTPSDFEDGIHPNAQGHEKIFIKVKGFLEEKGWI